MARNGFAAMTGGPRSNLTQADLDYIYGRDGATGGSGGQHYVVERRPLPDLTPRPQLRGTIDETAPALRGTLGPSDAGMGARAPAEAMGKARGGGGLRGVPEGMRSGIAATAEALGISPVDLATVISYETAGTFNPTKAGPTTQWGQHRGLIQFGEPQARKYGVDWKNPMQSQLGPDGAIAKYLRAAGVKPGMGIMDVYSAINAGGVGRYNRSDANNGGAPGTVADKVNTQMAGHRAKAVRMFGSDPMSTASITQPQRRQEQPRQSNVAPPEATRDMLVGGGDLRSRPMPGPAQSYEFRQPDRPMQQPVRVQDFITPLSQPQPGNAFASMSGGGPSGGFLENLFSGDFTGGGGGGDFWSM